MSNFNFNLINIYKSKLIEILKQWLTVYEFHFLFYVYNIYYYIIKLIYTRVTLQFFNLIRLL